MSGPRIVHVALADDWEGCRRFGEYDVATVATSFDDIGYIHASTSMHLPAVLERPYGQVKLPLLLIVLDEQSLASAGIDISWRTDGSAQLTPRILSPFPMEAPIVVEAIELDYQDGGWVPPNLAGFAVREDAPAAL